MSVSKAISLDAKNRGHRLDLARRLAPILLVTALFPAAAAAETANASLAVGATVLPSCLVSTQAQSRASAPVSVDCGPVAPVSIRVERIAVAGSGATSATRRDSSRLDRVTITY